MKKLISFLKNCFHLQNLYCENDVLLFVVLFRKRFDFRCKKNHFYFSKNDFVVFHCHNKKYFIFEENNFHM